MHFFMAGVAPLTRPTSVEYRDFSVQDVAQELLLGGNMLCRVNPYHIGKFIACSVLFRGRMSPKEVDQEILKVQSKDCSPFVEWIAGNIHSSICDVAPEGLSIHGTYLANSTAMH